MSSSEDRAMRARFTHRRRSRHAKGLSNWTNGRFYFCWSDHKTPTTKATKNTKLIIIIISSSSIITKRLVDPHCIIANTPFKDYTVHYHESPNMNASATTSILPIHHHTSPHISDHHNTATTSPFSPRSPRRRLFHRPRSSAACQSCFATIWILACSITFGVVLLSNRLVLPRTIHLVPPDYYHHQHRQPELFVKSSHSTTRSTFKTVQLLLQDNLVGSTAIDGPPLDAHEEERLAELERDEEEESPLSFLFETATHTVQLLLQENLFGSEAILKEEEEISNEKDNLVQDSDRDKVDYYYYADPMATTSFDEEESDVDSPLLHTASTTQRDLVYPEDWSSQEYEDDLV